MADSPSEPTQKTPLHAAHVELGARMVPFAGYDMPVQYPTGIIAEHNHARTQAGLFDVSHMGQAVLKASSHEAVAAALETLIPADILNLKPGQQRYSQFLNDTGGILDDLMVARPADIAQNGALFLVVNAARKDHDYAWMRERLKTKAELIVKDDRSLLALQGPLAADVMAQCIEATNLPFMGVTNATFQGIPIGVSRSGYTGEDGFELSVRSSDAEKLWKALLADPRVKPIGLGARDSLRLEAGLCLYGHDIDETTSPVEAGLVWSIQKRRRDSGGFPGAARIQKEIAEGPSRRRVGLKPEGRQPVREGAAIKSTDGQPIGAVTSGGFGPSVGGPVAMGYVNRRFSEIGTPVLIDLRGKDVTAQITAMPFTPHRYHRSSL